MKVIQPRIRIENEHLVEIEIAPRGEFLPHHRRVLGNPNDRARGGMPTRAASRAEAGLAAPGISSSGVTEPLGASVQPPSFQTSIRPEPWGSLINRTTSPSMTKEQARIFSCD